MRRFNKLFVIALPRCATVSLCDALGALGVRTAHLGRIYGEDTQEHHNPARLRRMHEQIQTGDYHFDVLKECDGLADYPACCFDVMRHLDEAFPNSLFINVRRERSISRWLQSVERQFVGLQLLKAGHTATEQEQAFMRVMLSFREMTFGQAKFEASAYHQAYLSYQQRVQDYFSGRTHEFLDIPDIRDLETLGYKQLCDFLECETPEAEFPRSNRHSEGPARAFMQALAAGQIQSQTGISVAALDA